MSVIVFLVALLPVLFIGAILVEMLLHAAPRRGKRPDVGIARASVRRIPQVCVLTHDGRLLSGSPQQVARQLGAWIVTPRAARARLDDLERHGRIRHRVG